MITKKVRDLIDDLDNISYVGGTSRSKNIRSVIERGRMSMLSKIKPKELTTTELITNAVHDNVFRYKVSDKLNRKYIQNIFELSKEHNVESFHHNLELISNRAFSKLKTCDVNKFTIEYENGIKYLRASYIGQTTQGYTIHTMDSLDKNGHWNALGNIVNLKRDSKTFKSGSGCLSFDINDSSNTGYVENFTLKPFDLTDRLNNGTVFTWLDIPNYNEVLTLKLTLASSLNDYYEVTINRPYDSDKFQPGDNLVGFDLQDVVITGVPEINNINRVRITIETTGTEQIKNVRIDNIVLRDGTVFGIKFITDWIYRDAESMEIIQDYSTEEDAITLEYDTYMCLMYECALHLVHDIYGPSEEADPVVAVRQMLKDQYNSYFANNKDEFILEQQNTYSFNTSYDHEFSRADK